MKAEIMPPQAPAMAPVAVQSSDSDADGVEDARDRCPGTAPGTVVDPNGCPLDSDGDGVADAYDRCPNTEAGLAVGPNGCALNNDEDNDGIANDADQCPDTSPDTTVDGQGCPPPPPACESGAGGVELAGCAPGQTLVLHGVNFEFDEATLTRNATSLLDQVVFALEEAPQIRVEIGGHTDARGSDAYNQELSERRAQSVVGYLIGQGIAAERLEAVGYGEVAPVADNETDEGEPAGHLYLQGLQEEEERLHLEMALALSLAESNAAATSE